jgi:tyrosine-protein phosphatase YwqE
VGGLFSIFSKKKPLEKFPFERLGTDMHSHLLPGIDDGSPDTETSLMLIRGLQDLGYRRFITTPHVMEDLYRNNKSTIQEAYKRLKESIDLQPGFDVDIRYAAEYLLDGNVDNMLAKNTQMLTLKDKMVLVEVSFVSPPLHFKEVLFELQMKGYQPVFAHPERYGFYHAKPSEYEEIRDMGCLFQCNLLSFSGYYGAPVRQAAEYLVKKGLVDLLGTDIHHEKHLHALQALELTPSLSQLLEQQGVMNSSL